MREVLWELCVHADCGRNMGQFFVAGRIYRSGTPGVTRMREGPLWKLSEEESSNQDYPDKSWTFMLQAYGGTVGNLWTRVPEIYTRGEKDVAIQRVVRG